MPFLDGSGKPRQYLAIRSDITARKNAEAQIREQAALTHLGQLAAVVAHEVRNPLAGLRASLQVFGRRFAESRDREIIATMIQRIDELNAKVEDLLLYARPKPARRHAVDVRALIHEVAVNARTRLQHRGGPIAAACVIANPKMMRTAPNLLLNACQASDGAPVKLTTRTGDSCNGRARYAGPGSPPTCASACSSHS